MPACYQEEIEQQLQDMLKMGIIEESSNPWMAPAVFVPKKSGEIRICIDYREAQQRLSQRRIHTTTPWWSSRLLGWVDSIFNPRPSKRILAIATAPWWLWEDSILSGTGNGPIPVSPNALWVIKCSKFLSKIDGYHIPRTAIRYEIHRRCPGTLSQHGGAQGSPLPSFPTTPTSWTSTEREEMQNQNEWSALPRPYLLKKWNVPWPSKGHSCLSLVMWLMCASFWGSHCTTGGTFLSLLTSLLPSEVFSFIYMLF